MYRILLVDDEPLILSGIKFMLDWEKHDCQIIDTARNGQEALEKIRVEQPDIVLCDISMPVMSGIDLLSAASAEFPSTVFIMLTNLQDFELAKTALQYKAVDYVVKNQMEADTLEASLTRAVKEWEARNRLEKAGHMEQQERTINDLLWKELLLRPGFSANLRDMAENLAQDFNMDAYAVLYIILDYGASLEAPDKNELYKWEYDLVETMARKHFPACHLIDPDGGKDSILLLASALTGTQEDYHDLTRQFFHKLSSSSLKITRLPVSIMATERLRGIESLAECRCSLNALINCYYDTEQKLISAWELPPASFQPLGLTGITTQLVEAIREKSSSRCSSLFQKAVSRMQSVCHERSAAIWLCSELYTAVGQELKPILPAIQTNHYFSQPDIVLNQIELLHTRSQVIAWLEHLKDITLAAIDRISSDKNDFVEAAIRYVEDHIEEHISLSDAADWVNISPAYFSSCFSKMCGQSFIDYVNARKMEYACRMIQEDKYRIYEISYRLGFNNAYYFTKIFKRHIGMTPMEYHNSQKKERS